MKKAQEAPTLVEMQMKLQEDFNKRLTFNPHYYNASYVVSPIESRDHGRNWRGKGGSFSPQMWAPYLEIDPFLVQQGGEKKVLT